ncbi:molybdopterin-dependent oxidoreductase, partial [Symbiobacterium thermophilum]
MTNHWNDYQNTDVFMVLGTNPAENHPISMRWIDRARETRGAKLIVVDPKFNRTAAKADL